MRQPTMTMTQGYVVIQILATGQFSHHKPVTPKQYQSSMY